MERKKFGSLGKIRWPSDLSALNDISRREPKVRVTWSRARIALASANGRKRAIAEAAESVDGLVSPEEAIRIARAAIGAAITATATRTGIELVPSTGNIASGHACREDDAPYPQLRRCRVAATSLDDPEHGVGISVNRWFKSVNWVAIPGYHLFFDGNLKPGERLTRTQFEALERQAIDASIYKGVAFHHFPGAQSDTDLPDFLEWHGIGTDFALQFARTVFCARLPVTVAMMDEVIAFLNDKNREYAEGKADYNWSVSADNCSHTLRNALAAANIWSPLSVRAIKIRQIFNLAIPANEFVNLAELMTQEDIGDYRTILSDGPRRDAFHEFHWLPTEPGALLKTLPVHSPNDLYDTRFRLFTLQSPFLMGKTQRAIDLLSDQRFVDLDANLHYFAEKYDAILARHDEERDTMATVRGTPFHRVAQLYDQYIHTQRDEVQAMQRVAAVSSEPLNPPTAK